MKKQSFYALAAVPLAAVALGAVLTFSGIARSPELKVRDLYTAFVPPPPESPSIVLVDVDDRSIQAVGQWPWSRDIHARYLADLRALGLSSLSFDIEFIDPGIRGLSNQERDSVTAGKAAELQDVFRALGTRQVSVSEAGDYASLLLKESVELAARDNDRVLGQAMKVFGRVYTTLNYDGDLISFEGNTTAEEALTYLKDHATLGPVAGQAGSAAVKGVPGLRGNIVPIASAAAGASVTNVVKDDDGTLRRMALLYRLAGPGAMVTDSVYGQLAFVPYWESLGRPAIEAGDHRIVLKTSKLADHPQPDVVIPLDDQGELIINWPHKDYAHSFRHVGISELQTLERAWDDPALGLKPYVVAMQAAGYFTRDYEAAVVQAESDRAAALAAGDQKAFDAAEAALTAWRASLAEELKGRRQGDIKAALADQANDPKLSAAARQKASERLGEVDSTYAALDKKLSTYNGLRSVLEAKVKGAWGVYGWTSAATTDIGVTPFDPKYYNPGTHAAVANTLVTRAFLNEWPGWASFLLGAVLALLALVGQTRLGTLSGVIAGFGLFAVLLVGVGVAYAATGVYAGALVPGIMVFVTVLGLTLQKFWGTEADRRYIRQAFGTYLSPEVIKQLESDPDKLNLGGEKKVLTAMFTDVKGFSTISESMDPNDLVHLLNLYLTRMSDIVLDERGTIDKFEGDAIIAFWGAPLPFEDHALRAVRAALTIKTAEAALNEALLAENLAPGPLLTRIGLNTGEMTVGNMGTARRMDYTMMGNSVNLAARLEGVNKQYGTWILTAQPTVDRLDASIVTRKLDRVRVVGISTPVRLYEIVAFHADAPDAVLEKVALFERGVDDYERRDWDAARKAFEAVVRLDPNDGPAKVFLERTAKNREAGLDAKWDGVYNLTTK